MLGLCLQLVVSAEGLVHPMWDVAAALTVHRLSCRPCGSAHSVRAPRVTWCNGVVWTALSMPLVMLELLVCLESPNGSTSRRCGLREANSSTVQCSGHGVFKL